MEASRNEGVIEQTAPPKIKAKQKKHPQFNTRSYLQKIHSVDVLAIYGISDIAAIEILSEKKPNGATQAFKSAANGVQRSQHWLGDYFRRMKAKGGNKYAIVATARKLAIIYYKMVRYHQNFIPFDNQEYKSKFQRTKIAYLERILFKLKGETLSVI